MEQEVQYESRKKRLRIIALFSVLALIFLTLIFAGVIDYYYFSDHNGGNKTGVNDTNLINNAGSGGDTGGNGESGADTGNDFYSGSGSYGGGSGGGSGSTGGSSGSGGSGGDSGGGDGGSGGEMTPPPSGCSNDIGCSAVGDFCDSNIPYSCSVGTNGCLVRSDKQNCSSGYICSLGRCVSGCVDECNSPGSGFCYGNTPYSCVLKGECYARNLSSPCVMGQICISGKCQQETLVNSVMFQDNFDDGNFNRTDSALSNPLNWSTVSGSAYTVDRINNKSLALRRQNTTLISEQIIGASEFTVEYDLSIVWSWPSKLILLYNNPQNYYYFSIQGGTFYRVMDGITERLDDKAPNFGVYNYFFGLPHSGRSDGRYKVYVKNNGSELIFKFDKNGYSNGIDYEMEIIDRNPAAVSKFVNGKIGFGESADSFSTTASIFIDNVRVYNGFKQNQRLKPIETFYVSTTGDDANLGTLDKPFRTLTKATSLAQSGDTILIAPGVYREGNVPIAYSGAKGAPITIKAQDSSKKPIFTGTVTLNSANWTKYNSNVYKTVVNWMPASFYLNETPLFAAQEPNQHDPDNQMQTLYFFNVSNENNESKPEAHYSLIDSSFFTQQDPNYWRGAGLLLYDSFANAISGREILQYLSSEKKVIMNYNRWIESGSSGRTDKFAVRGLQVLDNPGEYFIDKGRIDVLSWKEGIGTMNISVKMISGAGEVSKIIIYFINESSGQEFTIDTRMLVGEQKNLVINMSGKIKNNIRVYAEVASSSLYELYVWPSAGYSPEQIEISKESGLISFAGLAKYNEYIVLDGLEIKQYTGTPLSFEVGYGSIRYGTVRNCDIHHNMGTGVNARCDVSPALIEKYPNIQGKCSGLVIEDSKLHNNYGNGVSFSGGMNFTVQRCEVWENLDNGVWCGNGGGIPIHVWNVFIKNNYIHDQGSDRTHPDNIQLYSTANTVIDGNYLTQKGHQNVWISHGGPVWFTNNIVKNGVTGINSANESYVYNNIFYSSTVRYDAHQEANDPLEIPYTQYAEMRNNIFIGSSITAPPEFIWPRFSASNNFFSFTSCPSWLASEAQCTDNINNPETNASKPESLYTYFAELDKFTLKQGSSLIDAGYPVNFVKDYSGSRRYQGKAPDIGYLETPNTYSYGDCFNQRQDGNEQGVDCGGICAQDFDGDGYSIGYCGQNMNLDCNDVNSRINPGASEVCDAIDNNCDGTQHPDYYKDSDSDGLNNCLDNCPSVANTNQLDGDNDRIGDVCDPSYDYVEDFDDRPSGYGKIYDRKKTNGLSWQVISGDATVQIEPNGNRYVKMPANNTIAAFNNTIIAKEGSEWQNINFSISIGKAYSITAGFIMLYKDSSNFYYFNLYTGALIKVKYGIQSEIFRNSNLSLGYHDSSRHNYTTQISVNGNEVRFGIKRDNSSTYNVLDREPASNKGTIGLYYKSSGDSSYFTLTVDDIKVSVPKSGSFAASGITANVIRLDYSKISNWFKSDIKGITGNFFRMGLGNHTSY